eukprot:COSAG04_NODE_216_length_19953_cov_85.343558_3_plen_192_part_00
MYSSVGLRWQDKSTREAASANRQTCHLCGSERGRKQAGGGGKAWRTAVNVEDDEVARRRLQRNPRHLGERCARHPRREPAHEKKAELLEEWFGCKCGHAQCPRWDGRSKQLEVWPGWQASPCCGWQLAALICCGGLLWQAFAIRLAGRGRGCVCSGGWWVVVGHRSRASPARRWVEGTMWRQPRSAVTASR